MQEYLDRDKVLKRNLELELGRSELGRLVRGREGGWEGQEGGGGRYEAGGSSLVTGQATNQQGVKSTLVVSTTAL